MNRLIMIYGCVLLSSTTIAAVQQSTLKTMPLKDSLLSKEKFENGIATVDSHVVVSKLFSVPVDNEVDEANDLDLSTIEYVEEEIIELGFDPYDYLPEHFNPHTFYFDITSVEFIDEEDHSLGFDTEKYLPTNFNAYKESTDFSSIHFMEEEDFTLGFDTQKYLPEGFSPYIPYFNLDSIRYMEMNEIDDDFLLFSEADCKVEEPLN